MSMDQCAECGNPVDTDDHPDAYVGPPNQEQCVCEHCQETMAEYGTPEDNPQGWGGVTWSHATHNAVLNRFKA